MAALYADENVPQPLTVALRAFGHDVLTAREDGRANQKIPDPDVLGRTIDLGRAILTNNRKDFHNLHKAQPVHTGIITFTDDRDITALADRIHAAISSIPALAGQLIKITKPG